MFDTAKPSEDILKSKLNKRTNKNLKNAKIRKELERFETFWFKTVNQFAWHNGCKITLLNIVSSKSR